MSAKQLTLLDLPITVANHVLEKLELKELLTCRKVCRSLRTAVDKLGAHFTVLSVRLKEKYVLIRLNGIAYTYTESTLGGTNVAWEEYRRLKRKFFSGENYLNIAFNDLKILLKHASCLTIETTLEDEKDDREHAVNYLVDVLKEEGNIHMESIRLHSYLSIDDVLLILPLFNSQTLKYIELGVFFPDHEFERITHLDQWKKAKYFYYWEIFCDFLPIEHLLHFEGFNVTMEDFPIQNLIKIRDDLLQRCTFQKCTIMVLKKNFTSLEFARIFQPDYTGGDKFTLEYSNENSKFGIKLGNAGCHNVWEFEIERC